MIHRLAGKVISHDTDFVTLDVSGVGYRIYTPASALGGSAVGNELVLWTHLVVREDKLELYGFGTKEELDFFELLIGVSGVGPKSAVAILSLAPVETLSFAIGKGDIVYLTKVSGIGKKTAEKIVLELREKVALDERGSLQGEDAEVLDALMSLGYNVREAREALKLVSNTISGTGERVREALKFISKTK